MGLTTWMLSGLAEETSVREWTGKAITGILFWVVVILAAGVVFLILGRYLKAAATSAPPKRSEGLTIEQLEQLYRDGALTRQEFDQVRRAALGLRQANARPDGSAEDAHEAGQTHNDADPDR